MSLARPFWMAAIEAVWAEIERGEKKDRTPLVRVKLTRRYTGEFTERAP